VRILISNDDGIGAPALPVLASRLARDGHDVVVAAPLEAHSGCGASIGKVEDGQVFSIAEVSLAGAEGVPAFAVDGPPAFIVLAAVQGVLGARPDVVVTGPNAGVNLGPLTLHSGTLGAAITAASNGLPGIALSTQKRARFGFASAAEFCALNLGKLLDYMEDDCALNINVPDLPLDEIAGIRLTRFAPKSLYTIVLTDAGHDAPGSAGKRHMSVSLHYDKEGASHRKWRAESGKEDDSDAGAIIDGYISVTVVHGGLRHLDGEMADQTWRGLG
jgi:5'-nucleotidase